MCMFASRSNLQQIWHACDLTTRVQWTRCLRRRSAAAWLLGSRVRIPHGAWMVCLLCLYVVLSCVGRGLCDGLITRPEESYRVSVCVWSRNPERKAKGPSWTISEWMNCDLRSGRNFRKVKKLKVVLDLSPGEDSFCSSGTKHDRKMASRPKLFVSERS
jgi:hypothetical protein